MSSHAVQLYRLKLSASNARNLHLECVTVVRKVAGLMQELPEDSPAYKELELSLLPIMAAEIILAGDRTETYKAVEEFAEERSG